MKALKRTGIVVGILIAVVIAIGFILPSKYQVERRIVINAEPAQIHALVGDLKRWPEWGPWEEDDPSIVTALGDITRGVGAYQSWTSDSGNGELIFTSSSPERGVAYNLSFDDAWHSVVAIRYEKSSTDTQVVWHMKGDAGFNPIGRYFGVFMDSMVGPMFERGLERLKVGVESEKAG